MTSEKHGRRRPDAFEAAAAGIEHELRRLVPVPVPPGLRSRIVARASEARRGALLRPWMRVATAACSVLIAALLALDPLVSRLEEARLTALLDGHSAVASRTDIAPELAEAGLGPGTEAEHLARLQDLAASRVRKSMEKEAVEALERLKGRWEYEAAENPY